MPQFPGFPGRPHYNSVKAYLSELAKDIAEMVVDPVKMERFREQLKIYADLWKQWITADEADRQGCWAPSMGRPECIFNIFSRSYNLLNNSEKEEKRLAGSYALCALIYDSQLPHLNKINTDIIPTEVVEETLSAPRNTLEDRGIWNSGPDVREIYLIEEFFNLVKVDLQEFCKLEETKLKQATIKGQIQQTSQLSDEEFMKLTAKKFEDRAKKVLSKDETWHDLDRSLKGWFDAAVERLKKLHFTENEIGLLSYIYKNLLHYTRNINIKNFRGFPDSRIVELACSQADELAEKFKRIDTANKNYKPLKGSYKAQQKLAFEEAEELVTKAERDPNKEDTLFLYTYATQALRYAVEITKMTRDKRCLSVDQFIASQVRLFEYSRRLNTYPDIANIFDKWPANPGITFTWLAGQNALDVAIQFIQMINNGVIAARNETLIHGVTSYDELIVSPEPDAAFEKWRDRAITEILTYLLPKSNVWPNMADIHRDYGSLCYKLKDEYNRAVKSKTENNFSNHKRLDTMEWDIFLCHASEDKENFVEPLANALSKAGVKVWYDRFELKLGDSLREKIDEGLANSRYGVVILSSHFFKKNWAKTELDALVNRQNEDGKKVILPIWHGIGIEEVKKFSPILASKLAAQSSDSLESIVVQIKKVLNENSTHQKLAKDKKEAAVTGQEKNTTFTSPKFTDKTGKVFEGNEAWEKMWEKFLEFGRYTIPEKPFAGKPTKITDNNYSPGEGYRELLTEEERKLLLNAIPQLSDAGLEAVLRRVYNMGDERIKNLTWKQIFTFCKDYINSPKPNKPPGADHGNKDTKSEREEMIEPKPPVFLQNLLWMLKYGIKHLKLLLLAALLLFAIFILPKVNLSSGISSWLKWALHTSGSYQIESLSLQAIDCLNDSKGDEFRIRLFAAGKEIENNQENAWHPITEGNSVAVDVNSFKFNENSKETFITVRLLIKDKKNDKEIPIDDIQQHFDLKGNHSGTCNFKKHYPIGQMVRYSLEYKISQKGGS
jgi:hypothetical protein